MNAWTTSAGWSAAASSRPTSAGGTTGRRSSGSWARGRGFGVAGICPGATIRTISLAGPGQTTATAIFQAADLLNPGDLILLEAHRPGPESTSPFRPNVRQIGYIPIEWWPDDYAAIAYAVCKGVIVVAAAGNGGVSLDAPIYDQNPGTSDGYGPFPDWWENPFRRKKLDSGAILVGAGAPPSGRSGPDRSRLDFSNHGVHVDVQGWGREVVTTGYGDLQGPRLFEDLWYTQSFGGTSSASAIIVGALACLQGAIRASGSRPLNSSEARDLLGTTGSPQVPRPGRDGYDLQLMSWGDGTGVPTSGSNLVIVGLDNNQHLHIRVFDISGKEAADADEASLPAAQAGAISALKEELPGLLPPHVPTDAEKSQVVREATSIVGLTRRDASEPIGSRPDLKQLLLASGIAPRPGGEDKGVREPDDQGRGPAVAGEADGHGAGAGGGGQLPDAWRHLIDRLDGLEAGLKQLAQTVGVEIKTR